MRAASPRRLALALLGCLGAAACGASNSLDGSIGDVLPIAFDDTAFYSDGSSLIVNYRKGSDLVCKLVIDALHSHAAAGSTLAGSDFTHYVTLSRVTASGDAFPPLLNGTLKLTSFSLASGAEVGGSFTGLFNEGHTILGKFSGAVRTQ